jgi:hypothetical protein
MVGILDMAGTARRGKTLHGACRGGAVGLLALILVSAEIEAAELNLLATSSVSVTGATVGGTDTSIRSFINSLDTSYNRVATQVLSYRLRLLASDTESSISSGPIDTRSSTWFVQPEGDLTLAGPRYSMNAGIRFRESSFSGTLSPSFKQMQNYEFIRAFLTPDLLPALNLQFERDDLQDDQSPRGLDRERSRAVIGATYGVAQKLNLAYTFTWEAEDDNAARRERELQSHVGSLDYTDSFFENRLSVNANYLINRLDTTETFTATTIGGAITLPIVLSRAFNLVESDPAVAANSKVPPGSYGTLTTSTSTTLGITAPLVVNQGGTPNLNQSIAFGLTPGASVTTIRLTVSPRAGDPRDISLQASGVSFQVFSGTNPNVNLTGWTTVAIVSVTLPTTVDQFFEIAIGATSGTFLKVHVAADPQQPALPPLTATAISAFSPVGTAGAVGRVTTGNLLQSFTANILAQPIQNLTLNASGNFNTNEQDPSGRRDNSATYSLTATGTPHRLLTVTGLYQGGFTSSDDPLTLETQTRNASLTLSSTPVPTLTSALSGSWSESDLGDVTQNRVTGVSFNTAMIPYRNLNADFTASATQAENFVDDSTARVFSLNLNANGTLTTRLSSQVGYTFSSGEISGGPAPSSLISNIGFLSLTYTVSRFLDLNSRWDVSVSNGNTTFTQAYRLNVIPTLKTSLILAYLRTDLWGPVAGESTDTVTLNATWNISRYLFLSTFGSFTQAPGGGTVYTVSGTLSFRL